MNEGFIRLMIFNFIVVGIIPGCVIRCQNENEIVCRQPFECGRLSGILYPFYGGNRSVSCGYPGFDLTCQGHDAPLINTSSITYGVLAIDGWTQTLTLSRNDLWTSLCDPLLVNTTLNTTFYNFYSPANDQEIALIYGCTSAQISPIPSPNQFSCSANDGVNGSGFFSTNLSDTSITCGARISVRVNQNAAAELERNPSIALLQTSLQSGFTVQWSADNHNCSNCVQSGGFCGFNQTLASFACYCTDGSYESTCPNTPNQNGSEKGLSDLQKFVVIGVSLCVPGLVISSIIIYYFKRHRRLQYLDRESNQNVEKFLLKHGSLAPKRYNYNAIKKMTKFFQEELGQGGYGIVYKGELPDGQLVAVKVLTATHDNAEEFINEVASISRTSHVNIVYLLGFCYERNKRALVYEFMPNKSLDKFIYKSGSTDPECSLEWETLFKISVGVARGLEYLHRGCNTRIVHFDIKPQNILLDEDFCPKISDFGLAQLFKQKQSIISMFGARGTIGYIAPEVFSRNFGVVSHKSDVYSYGMMLLQMAEAREMVGIETIQSSENYFPENIYEHVLLKKEKLDERMTEKEEETVRKMVMVGLWCIQTAPSDRPSMSKAVEMLEGSLHSIQIPPKPFFPSATLSGPISSSIKTDSENSD